MLTSTGVVITEVFEGAVGKVTAFPGIVIPVAVACWVCRFWAVTGLPAKGVITSLLGTFIRFVTPASIAPDVSGLEPEIGVYFPTSVTSLFEVPKFLIVKNKVTPFVS